MNLAKKWGIPILSILLVCIFPCAFLYFQNAGEAHASELLPMLGLFLATAAVVFLVLLLILRNPGRAGLETCLVMLVVTNFSMVSDGIAKLIPGFQSEILLALAAVALLALLALLMKKKPDMTVVCGLVALAFGAMIFMNGIIALPTMISTATYEAPVVEEADLEETLTVEAPTEETTASENLSAEEEMLSPEEASELPPDENKPPRPHEPGGPGGGPGHGPKPDPEVFTKEKRNVYFFIFDEYGGSENLKHYYDYDNEEFLTALEDKGFSVSRSSRNPESPWTVTLIPNIMNLDYVTSDEVEVKNRKQWLEDPRLYQLFRGNGYHIDLINHEGFLGERGCNVITRGRRQENIGDMIFDNTLFGKIPGVGDRIQQDVLHQTNDEYGALMDVSRALRECGRRPKPGPTLTVGYFVMPHYPFAADEHGRPTDPATYYEWRDNGPYMGMLKYTNGVILEAVEEIHRHDPDAVILLMADHGARKPGHIYNQFGGPTFDAEVESKFMMNVLCCVYDPKNKVEIEGDTCINAARKTFDAAFGTELGTLPVPPDYELGPDDIIENMGRGY